MCTQVPAVDQRSLAYYLRSGGYCVTALGDRLYVCRTDKRSLPQRGAAPGRPVPLEGGSVYTYVATVRVKLGGLVVELLAPYPREASELLERLKRLVDEGRVGFVAVEKDGALPDLRVLEVVGFEDAGSLLLYERRGSDRGGPLGHGRGRSGAARTPS